MPMIVKSVLLFLWFINLATSEKGKSYETTLRHACSSSFSSQEKEKKLKHYYDKISGIGKPQIPAKCNIQAQNAIQTHLSKLF